MTIRIPTSTTLPAYSQTTTLDGRNYLFSFAFNEREGTWFVSLADADGVPIVEGEKVIVQLPLFSLVTDPRRPPGVMMAIDTTAPETDYSAEVKTLAQDPGLFELGTRVKLVYFPADELVALGIRS